MNSLVSIVLPTYNRAAMFAEGLESIAAQKYKDWELIIVDDGSTDRNQEIAQSFEACTPQRVKYIYQENQGAGVARQRALAEAQGELIAFMDSDDPWMPHHLSDCVQALNLNHDVDWVVAPAKVVNELTDNVIHENSFLPHSKPKAFFNLKTEKKADLNVIVDPYFTDHVINNEFPGGLQAAVFRRWIIDKISFLPFRLYDDVGFRIEAAANGARVAYFTEPHILYRIHDSNVSLVRGDSNSINKRLSAYRDGAAVYSALRTRKVLSKTHRRMLDRKRAEIYFWSIGFNTLLNNGQVHDAVTAFREGLRVYPFSLSMWKTFIRYSILSFFSSRQSDPRL